MGYQLYEALRDCCALATEPPDAWDWCLLQPSVSAWGESFEYLREPYVSALRRCTCDFWRLESSKTQCFGAL